MSNIMTIRTKQNPLLLFLRNKFFLVGRNNSINFNICFAIHLFIKVMKRKSSDWQIRNTTIKTFISKVQDKFCFNHLSVFSPSGKVFFSSYRRTVFAISSYTKSFSMTFRKIGKFLRCFTSGAPSMRLTIYNWFHHHSIANLLVVIKFT